MPHVSSAFVAVCAKSGWVPSTRSSTLCPTRRSPGFRTFCLPSAVLSFDDALSRGSDGLEPHSEFLSVVPIRGSEIETVPAIGNPLRDAGPGSTLECEELTALGLDVGGAEYESESSRNEFARVEDDEEEDEGDEDEDEDEEDDDPEKEDDEDEDLASYEIETDDEDDIAAVSGRQGFDEDGLPIGGSRTSGSLKGGLGIGGVDADEDDDVVDFEEEPAEVLDVSSESTPDAEDDDVEAVLGLAVGADEDEAAEEELRSIDSTTIEEDSASEDLLDEESEAELRSAAASLKGSSLLGLGVAGGGRADSSEVASYALGDTEEESSSQEESATTNPVSDSRGSVTSRQKKTVITPSPGVGEFSDLVKRAEETTVREEEEELDVSGEDEEDFEDPALEDDPVEGPKNLDAYTDNDEHDDELADFGVTTSTNFGRVWELNDDAYVTISEAGEAYAYDIDEADSDDQDSAVLRRGAAAGWGGSLQSDARSALPVGSKEWIARRAYDLVAEATPSEMFKWTRARKAPPSKITSLFPPEPPAPAQFAPTILDTSVPSPDGDDSSTWVDDENARHPEGLSKAEVDYEPVEGQNAIERAVDFPCMYKFKVVGSGPDFVTSLTSDMEAVLGRKVPSSAFEFEPAGRYQRIIISVEVENARQVTELYEAVRIADGVKFSYG